PGRGEAGRARAGGGRLRRAPGFAARRDAGAGAERRLALGGAEAVLQARSAARRARRRRDPPRRPLVRGGPRAARALTAATARSRHGPGTQLAQSSSPGAPTMLFA